MIYGYARASTEDQSLDVQLDALRRAGCDVVRSEKRSGTAITARVELRTLLDFLRSGDVLVVTRIDRLARSVADLADITRELRTKGVELRATEQPIDTGTPAGAAFLQMLGVFAEFETALRRERQAEGIAKAKARGAYTGRKPFVDRAAVAELRAAGLTPYDIAKRLGISRASVYRALPSAPLVGALA